MHREESDIWMLLWVLQQTGNGITFSYWWNIKKGGNRGTEQRRVCACACVSNSWVPSVWKNNWLLVLDQELIIRLLPLHMRLRFYTNTGCFSTYYSELLLYRLHPMFKLQVILVVMFNSTFTVIVIPSAQGVGLSLNVTSEFHPPSQKIKTSAPHVS